MLRLTVVEGKDAGEVFISGAEQITLGAAADNDVCLTDPYVSRHHGRLSKIGGRWTYRDLGSTNGSALERGTEKIALDRDRPEIEIAPGNSLILGETILRLEIGEPARETTPQRTIVASRSLQDLSASRERVLANLGDLTAAYELERQIGLAFQPEEMLEAILDTLLNAFEDATHIILLLADRKTGKPRRQLAKIRGKEGAAQEELVVSMSIANRVLREGKSLLFRDVAGEFGDSNSIVTAGICSSMCVPLWTGEETVGLIQVESRRQRASFSERDLEVLGLFANRAALAIIASELCEAEHTNRLLRDLSAMITHDLKSPLTSIMGFLGILSEEKLNPDQKEFVDISLAASKWLSILIAGILDVAKMEAGEVKLRRESVCVKETLEQALAMLAYQIKEKNIRLETAVAADLPTISVDPEIFQRIVVNLVGNSVKFSPEGSRLTVSAAPEAGAVVISIQDEGPGISKENQERIFDKFVQVETGKRAEKISVGLGLAFCKLAVEAHGGRIWVESEPGHGSRFSFSLPVTANSME